MPTSLIFVVYAKMRRLQAKDAELVAVEFGVVVCKQKCIGRRPKHTEACKGSHWHADADAIIPIPHARSSYNPINYQPNP